MKNQSVKIEKNQNFSVQIIFNKIEKKFRKLKNRMTGPRNF